MPSSGQSIFYGIRQLVDIPLNIRTVKIPQGRILIDGIDIEEVGLETLRTRLALVPQESTLFIGTLRENMCVAVLSLFVLLSKVLHPLVIRYGNERTQSSCLSSNGLDSSLLPERLMLWQSPSLALIVL